jgi:TRAP transporter TAXI family solute receptor
MRIGFLFGVVATLIAIATPSGASAAEPNWPKSLTLATASPGGVYYLYGEALAKILTEKLSIPVNHLPTQGPVHNVKLVEDGGAQLGLITMGVGLQGWEGTGDWAHGKKFRNMRALFPMYDTPFQAMVFTRSGITTLGQLENKRICVGPRAGTGGTYIPKVMKIIGVSAIITNGSFADMANALISDQCAAIVTFTGAPLPAIQKSEAKEQVMFISLSSEQIDAVRKAVPEFSPSKIAAGTYRNMTKDYDSLGLYNFAIGRADLPDDLVYQLVKAVFGNQPRLLKASSTASETVPQNVAKDTFLPFHPGAARYYREVGIKIPELAAPTN